MDLAAILILTLAVAGYPAVFELGRRQERKRIAAEKERISRLTAVQYPHRQQTRRSIANPEKSRVRIARIRGRRRKKF